MNNIYIVNCEKLSFLTKLTKVYCSLTMEAKRSTLHTADIRHTTTVQVENASAAPRQHSQLSPSSSQASVLAHQHCSGL